MNRINERDLLWLQYLAKGYTAKMIADEVRLSQDSIENMIQHILLKLNARNKTEAVAIAIKNKLIEV